MSIRCYILGTDPVTSSRTFKSVLATQAAVIGDLAHVAPLNVLAFKGRESVTSHNKVSQWTKSDL